MYRKLGAVILILLLSLTGCASVDYSPRPIDSSLDICSSCNMTISDNHFAGEIITKAGQAEKFDDLGCLALYLKKHSQEQELKDAAIYVIDYDTLEWIPAKDASYVQGAAISTPMSYGIAAFDSQESAQTFAQKFSGMKVMEWQEVLSSKQVINF